MTVQRLEPVPPIVCAPWCEDADGHPRALSRRDQTCWSPMPYVDLTIEDVGHYEGEAQLPRLGVAAYREWPMAKSMIYVHLDGLEIHPNGQPYILDGSLHLTAEEARRLAVLLASTAEEIERESGEIAAQRAAEAINEELKPPALAFFDTAVDEQDNDVCPKCRGAGKVRMCNGKWTYDVACPDCHADEFEALEVDGDHLIIGPAHSEGI